MKLTTKLRPLAVATTLAVSTVALTPAHADVKLPMGATLYGDLALAYTYTGSSTSGGSTSSALNDNVSLLGIKGDAAVLDGTKFIYDFNFILDMPHGGANPSTHLGYIGLAGPYGTVTAGRDNGLFSQLVDGSTYQTNWFYTPGMSPLQVDTAIKYVSNPSSGFQFGAQAFDLGKSAKTTNNYTVAGSYAAGPLTFGLGYTKYSKYGDGASAYTVTSDTNMFGEPTNTFAGQTIKSMVGASVGYKTGPFDVVAAYNSRKPYSTYSDGATTPTLTAQNTKTMGTFMLTGSYAVSDKVTLAGNWSNTRQSSDGTLMRHRGNIETLMVSYAPSDNLFFSFELQHSDKKANESSITGATGGGGTKSNTGIALGATYSF